MANYTLNDIRNVALIGHGAAGKTTLADLILHKAGAASRAGSVDDGSSVFDSDDDEKERKSSISSSIGHIDHDGKHINVIDTPGFPDFIGQVIGALSAVETAVCVISAGAGIEVNTRRTMSRASTLGIGRMIVINKCDGDNIDYGQLLTQIQETFGSCCVPVNLPDGLGRSFSGVVSTVTPPDTPPEGVPVDPSEVNQTLMDAIVEADEELMVRYLEGEQLSEEEVAAGLSKAVAAGTLIPILNTSAKSDVGVQELMDALTVIALPPTSVERKATAADGSEVSVDQKADGDVAAFVFKTRIDPFVAKMSFLRVVAGTLKKDSSLKINGDKTIKISQLLQLQGSDHNAVDSAGPGEIVAVVKIEDLHVGDTLSTAADAPRLEGPTFPTPMVGLAVEPKSRADQQKISGALQKVQDEDQTFSIYRDPQTKEMVMQGMSELHLQIVQHRMHHRDKVEIVTHQPKIPYRETVNGSAEGSYRHKKQSGGSGQFAEVHLKITSVPHGLDPEEFFTKQRFESMRSYHYDPDLNFAFIDRVTGGSVPNQFIPAVEKGVKERMVRGVLAGYQVQDCACELFFGKDHPVDSNETAFKTAASMCFRDIFMAAKPSLMEPIVQTEITVPEEKLGDVTSDLNSRRGRVEGMDSIPGGFQVIHAKVPLAEVMTYARSLSSMTGGQGSFSMELSHYEMVPPNEQAKIVSATRSEEEEE